MRPQRKLSKRCALRAAAAPGFRRVRFRWSEGLCGQGQGRTADLPLFRKRYSPRSRPPRAHGMRSACDITDVFRTLTLVPREPHRDVGGLECFMNHAD
jgi:hypothetical protein